MLYCVYCITQSAVFKFLHKLGHFLIFNAEQCQVRMGFYTVTTINLRSGSSQDNLLNLKCYEQITFMWNQYSHYNNMVIKY